MENIGCVSTNRELGILTGADECAIRDLMLLGLGNRRRYTKTEKAIFRLRPENLALCKLTEEFFPGIHFLDLLMSEQVAIKTMLMEQWETMIESKPNEEKIEAERSTAEPPIAEAENRQTRRDQQETDKHTTGPRSKWHEQRRKSYRSLFQNLEFTNEALECLKLLTGKRAIQQIDQKLGLMNGGHRVRRDSIATIRRTVFETRAGRDYRIYYDHGNGRTRILLIGAKVCQAADINRLDRYGP